MINTKNKVQCNRPFDGQMQERTHLESEAILAVLKRVIAWGNLTDYFSEYIEDAGGNIVAGLWNGIVGALKSIGSWILV